MMNITESHIYIRNLRCRAFHGVMPQERLTGNDYIVNLRVSYDLSKAMQTDDVADTLNYASVYQIIKTEMAKPSHLIENVAYRIAHHLFCAYPGILSTSIDIAKINPPMGAECDGAGVTVHLINDKTI